MTKPHALLLHGWAIGVHSVGIFAGCVVGFGFLIAWCAAFAVFHGIKARWILAEQKGVIV